MKGFQMERQAVKKALRYLGLEPQKSNLSDKSGVQYRCSSEIFNEIVVTCYFTGTVLVQGKDEAAKNFIGMFLKLRSNKLQREAISS